MKPDLPIPTYSSDAFTWKGNKGVTDASDLIGPLNRQDGSCRLWAGSKVWSDACDIGFYVISARTGAKMLFTYLTDEDGYDGELQVYSSGCFTITIFND